MKLVKGSWRFISEDGTVRDRPWIMIHFAKRKRPPSKSLRRDGRWVAE
jgi:hypothetical protein